MSTKESMNHFWEKLKEVYHRMEFRQRLMIAIMLAITFGIIIWMISWTTTVEYGLLFNNLDPADATLIRTYLRENKIPHKMLNQNKRIDVPLNMVYDLRLDLSNNPEIGKKQSQNSEGWEIFDRTTLGTTEFQQRQVNYVRAVQGELEKTILTIDGVENVRIHLVFPQERIFREDQNVPTASVTLRLSTVLSQKTIEGITYTIANSVEGLDPKNVHIVDHHGTTLNRERTEEEAQRDVANLQMDLRRQHVIDLTTSVESLLDRTVGPGNYVVSAAVELNFDQIERTSERFDPEGQVTRSEEIITNNYTSLHDSLASQSEHVIANYEISKEVSKTVNAVGDIRRLSVAAFVNFKRTTRLEDGTTIVEYVARTPEEMAGIEAGIRGAVGFNADRGDQVAVTSIQFDSATTDVENAIYQRQEMFKYYIALAEKGAVIVILMVMVFVLAAQFRKLFAEPEPEEEEELEEEQEEELRPALAEGGGDEGFYPEGDEGMPMGEGKISFTFKPMRDIEIEQTEAMLLQETIQKFVIENPEVTVKLIQSWLMDEKAPPKKIF